MELNYLRQVSVGQYAREGACGVTYTYSAACGPRWLSARDMLSVERIRSVHQVYRRFLNQKKRQITRRILYLP